MIAELKTKETEVKPKVNTKNSDCQTNELQETKEILRLRKLLADREEELAKFNEYRKSHVLALTNEKDSLILERDRLKSQFKKLSETEAVLTDKISDLQKEMKEKMDYITILEEKQRKQRPPKNDKHADLELRDQLQKHLEIINRQREAMKEKELEHIKVVNELR